MKFSFSVSVGFEKQLHAQQEKINKTWDTLTNYMVMGQVLHYFKIHPHWEDVSHKIQSLFTISPVLNMATSLWYAIYTVFSFLWKPNTSFTMCKSKKKNLQTTNVYLNVY